MNKTNYNTVPARKHRERSGKHPFRALALSALILAGVTDLVVETVKDNNASAPITAYNPNSAQAKKDPAAYDNEFTPYVSDSEHLLAGQIGAAYAKDHNMDNAQPVTEEVTRQAIEFNKIHYGRDDDPNVYMGETFMLPNEPHQAP